MSDKQNNSYPLFRTRIDFPDNTQKIAHNTHILSIGSCFSENIALRLKDFLFAPCINPTGILYNPASISQALRRLQSQEKYSKDKLFFHEGFWKSFDHHSSFYADTWKKCLQKINKSLGNADNLLTNPSTLIITFGTAFVYYKKDNDQLVANCHQLPHNTFKRLLLTVNEIVNDYTELFNHFYTQFPEINIMITVSPVRHLRDKPHENQVSKAHLLTAVHELEVKFPKLYYFPSYEIMMDELRDYRFYDEDMIHPAPVAVDYIWDRFITACLNEKSREFISQYEPVLRAKTHIIKDYTSEATHSFAKKQLEYIGHLEERFPAIPLTSDKEYFASLLKT